MLYKDGKIYHEVYTSDDYTINPDKTIKKSPYFKCELSKEEQLIRYNDIILSLNNKKTHDFISMCMGNNAMNTTELEYLLPIFT